MNSRSARSAATRASGSSLQVEHRVGGLGVQLAERETGDLEESARPPRTAPGSRAADPRAQAPTPRPQRSTPSGTGRPPRPAPWPDPSAPGPRRTARVGPRSSRGCWTSWRGCPPGGLAAAASCGRSRRPRRSGRRSGADRRLLLQRRRSLVAEQPARPEQVPLGRARGTQLLVDRRPDHEDLRQPLVESCRLGQPSGPVEQPPGTLLGELGADSAPGLRPQGDHLRFDVPGTTGLGNHGVGHRPRCRGVSDGGPIGRLRPRQQVGRPGHGSSRVERASACGNFRRQRVPGRRSTIAPIATWPGVVIAALSVSVKGERQIWVGTGSHPHREADLCPRTSPNFPGCRRPPRTEEQKQRDRERNQEQTRLLARGATGPDTEGQGAENAGEGPATEDGLDELAGKLIGRRARSEQVIRFETMAPTDTGQWSLVVPRQLLVRHLDGGKALSSDADQILEDTKFSVSPQLLDAAVCPGARREAHRLQLHRRRRLEERGHPHGDDSASRHRHQGCTHPRHCPAPAAVSLLEDRREGSRRPGTNHGGQRRRRRSAGRLPPPVGEVIVAVIDTGSRPHTRGLCATDGWLNEVPRTGEHRPARHVPTSSERVPRLRRRTRHRSPPASCG